MQVLAFVLLSVLWIVLWLVSPVLLAATLAVAVLAAGALYYRYAFRALTSSALDGPSPVAVPETAYRHYLIEQVWRDWWAINVAVVPQVAATARLLVRGLTRRLLPMPWGLLAFPVWLALCAGIVAAAVPAAVIGLVLTVLYGLVAAVGLAAWLACALVLAAVERVLMAYGRILQTCPHPFCYEKIALPEYACPNCGTRHRRLVPNTGGAFRHVCRCGTRLPTTVPLGRFRLSAFCPHCGGKLPDRIGRVRVEPLAFVGGPSAGKTTFMVMGIRALHARARGADGRVAFVEPKHAQAYAGAIREFQRGGRLAKTGPGLPLATMLDVDLPGRSRRILYLFDPAGEHYTGAGEVGSLRYLDHGEALLFVVDPFALPQVERSLTAEEALAVDQLAAASAEDPADTLQRVLNELRSRPDKGRQKRVAVVVTKTDLLVRTEIGRTLDDDPDLRSWLGRVGLGNTVRTLDQVAGQVRYFGSGPQTPPADIADLLGWVSGLGGEEGGAPADVEREEVPGTAPLRAAWPVRGRGEGRVPAGYQAGRWAVLAGLSLVTAAAVVAALVLALRYL
ncbi:zinc ribbon domain-containing protein [Actinomadura parmotrematis]|uniref:Zinc ribbon domain-containing protein n=1 Tax=Actinomadura parmotrematis TaxID=2864039 RepID=A0ABS7G1C4_9ACTN|nr:zinc ribbon domain-containing protein [Actinomadura parmotrematis]MBW8485453.1 zinc ribbon domain-containing protein [Actinomadura parmotrematis]